MKWQRNDLPNVSHLYLNDLLISHLNETLHS